MVHLIITQLFDEFKLIPPGRSTVYIIQFNAIQCNSIANAEMQKEFTIEYVFQLIIYKNYNITFCTLTFNIITYPSLAQVGVRL